jgi:hypothetical protein
MKNTSKTAAAAYSQNATTAQNLLKRIATRLAEHQTRQAAEPRDWGYVGDIGHINEELAQVLAALGDRSAIDDLGLLRDDKGRVVACAAFGQLPEVAK